MTMEKRITLHVGDITRLRVTAIANAANSALLGGGGVDGAIHRAAGRELLAECKTLGGCETGSCRLTGGYLLPAEWVLHCVGPVWRGGGEGEDGLLASCYRTALEIAAAREFETVAFPAISTGVYGFPADRAARIAVAAVRGFLAENAWPRQVVLVAFDDRSAAPLRTALAA